MTTRIRLPDTFRNPLSLLGMAIATAMALVFLVLILLELAGVLANPYIGLLIFVAVPTLLVLGLFLIPIGGWWSARRRRLHPERAEWPVIDLRRPRQRGLLVAVFALTCVNLVIVSLAAYGGVHYMDSSAFCGQVCHVTMEPEYASYQVSPHARVACAECHVGPGVGAVVQAKMAGTRQLYHVLTNQVPKPVPPPPHLIQPSRATCEGCHWPEKFHGDVLRLIRDYSNDQKSSESVTTLRMHVGGGSARQGGGGIHWHASPDHRVEFVATDETRQTIPYVRLTDGQGRVREFLAEGAAPGPIAAATVRTMECVDCHNRPAHTFAFTPERAVDTALAQGRLSRDLPFVRREAVAAVSADYPSREAGLMAIDRRLNEFYRTSAGADPRELRRAIATAQDVWARNVFPAMRVKWGTYPNHLGHVDTPGCFRCHDDSHKSKDGTVIRQDCELCHTTPE